MGAIYYKNTKFTTSPLIKGSIVVEILADNWETVQLGSKEYYKQRVSVRGMKTGKRIFGFFGEDVPTNESQLSLMSNKIDAYSLINNVVALQDAIDVYAYTEAPTVDFRMELVEVG